MTIDTVIQLGSQSLYMVLMLSLPMLVVALTVGVLISLFQAVTQIQEMTLTFVPKIIAVFLSLVFVAPWLTETMVAFTRDIILRIPNITL
jgi:flagellar biosynthesis protein FliQ